MKTKSLFSLSLMLGLTALLFTACENERIDYQLVAEEAGLVDQLSSDMFNTVDDESKNGDHAGDVGKTGGTSAGTAFGNCADITFNNNGGNWPKTLEIDFGSGCTDNYGVERKGILTLEYSGPYTDSGSVVTVTPTNYYVNDYLLDGTKIITNQGRNNDGKLVFSNEDVNGTITKPDGGVITWESEYTSTWEEGEGTILNFCDDVYHINGEVNGTISDGTSYQMTNNSPLVKKVCCLWLVQGEIEYNLNNGQETATVDYGTGDCDFIAEATWRGNTYTITVQ